MAEASDGNVTQEQLATVIKKVHSRLREDLICSGGEDALVWEKHLSEEETLTNYSIAMVTLATGPWIKHPEGEGSRIKWCIDAIREYYCTEGKLKQLLEKDIRRMGHGNPTLVDEPHLPRSCDQVADIVREFNTRRLKLLDVGSCYNPFKDYNELEVVAIDIAPANQDVLKCDFLNVDLIAANEQSKAPGCVTFPPSSFDIVVFSLLLSYLPSTKQRMQCCINAHRLLKLHGILLIITADSCHQNKHVDMMRCWKNGIEAVGYHRWKYEKEIHLHCMGFRKTRECVDYETCLVGNHGNLFINQDRPHPLGAAEKLPPTEDGVS